MRNHLRLPTLAIMALLVAAACSARRRLDGAVDGGIGTRAGESAAPSEPAASESAPAAVPTPEPATDCAQSDADNAMQMWERSGGNKGMVDQLVCDWNTANAGQADQPVATSRTPRWSARSPRASPPATCPT